MKRKNIVTEMMNEKINYGGFAMTRREVYADVIAEGLGHQAADFFAFRKDALTPEAAATFAQDGVEFLAAERARRNRQKAARRFANQTLREALADVPAGGKFYIASRGHN